MVLAALWKMLQDEVFPVTPQWHQGKPLFNFFSQINENLDRADAAERRRQNLFNYLSSFDALPTILIVGEAPGWKGCRFSGVPFTSEAQLASNKLPFKGAPTSVFLTPLSELSASCFWKGMQAFHPNFLVWNGIPYHPHHPNNPTSNRPISRKELRIYIHILAQVVHILQPQYILAVGLKAAFCLDDLSLPYISIRHPSHGGNMQFQQAMHSFMSSLQFTSGSPAPLD